MTQRVVMMEVEIPIEGVNIPENSTIFVDTSETQNMGMEMNVGEATKYIHQLAIAGKITRIIVEHSDEERVLLPEPVPADEPARKPTLLEVMQSRGETSERHRKSSG